MPLFGITGYRQLLADLAAAGYRMAPTEDDGPGRTCWMRHDVDVHLEGAGTIARIEREYGARSTWFVPVTFQFNVMHQPNRDILRDLVALGHNIGLHYSVDDTRDVHDLHHQVRVLEAAAGTRVKSITRHKPGSTKETIRQSAYREPFCDRYVSDSARRWRDDQLLRTVHAGESFLLLTHHEHWLTSHQDLMRHFSDSIIPLTHQQADRHATVTLEDCLTHA